MHAGQTSTSSGFVRCKQRRHSRVLVFSRREVEQPRSQANTKVVPPPSAGTDVRWITTHREECTLFFRRSNCRAYKRPIYDRSLRERCLAKFSLSRLLFTFAPLLRAMQVYPLRLMHVSTIAATSSWLVVPCTQRSKERITRSFNGWWLLSFIVILVARTSPLTGPSSCVFVMSLAPFRKRPPTGSARLGGYNEPLQPCRWPRGHSFHYEEGQRCGEGLRAPEHPEVGLSVLANASLSRSPQSNSPRQVELARGQAAPEKHIQDEIPLWIVVHDHHCFPFPQVHFDSNCVPRRKTFPLIAQSFRLGLGSRTATGGVSRGSPTSAR